MIHLSKEYDVYYCSEVKGKVYLEQEGMYYRIYCKSDVQINDPLCLWYMDNNKSIRLGLCTRGRMHLVARMRCTDLKDGTFCLKSKLRETEIYDIHKLSNPYFILQNLKKLRMKITEHGKGIIVENSTIS